MGVPRHVVQFLMVGLFVFHLVILAQSSSDEIYPEYTVNLTKAKYAEHKHHCESTWGHLLDLRGTYAKSMLNALIPFYQNEATSDLIKDLFIIGLERPSSPDPYPIGLTNFSWYNGDVEFGDIEDDFRYIKKNYDSVQSSSAVQHNPNDWSIYIIRRTRSTAAICERSTYGLRTPILHDQKLITRYDTSVNVTHVENISMSECHQRCQIYLNCWAYSVNSVERRCYFLWSDVKPHSDYCYYIDNTNWTTFKHDPFDDCHLELRGPRLRGKPGRHLLLVCRCQTMSCGKKQFQNVKVFDENNHLVSPPSCPQISFTSDSLNSSVTTQAGATVPTGSCLIPCPCRLNRILTSQKDKDEFVSDILKNLTLDKNNSLSYKRRYQSDTDFRPSAAYMGYVGILIMVLVFLFLLLLDSPSLITCVKTLLKTGPTYNQRPPIEQQKHGRNA